MNDNILHFLNHFIGLCGESHPSLIFSGSFIFISLSFYIKQIINYIKELF